MRNPAITLVILLTMTLAAVPVNADHSTHYLHHMHTLMNHSLTMAVQGSNLLMYSRTQQSQALGQIGVSHGTEMMAEGRRLLKDVLTGSEMKKAHDAGRWSDPLMGYTHELGAELLAVLDDLEKLDLRDPPAYQRQIALNHALEMAAEGSNLAMLGKMRMAGDIDDRAAAHGEKMLADGRKLWDRVAAGGGVKEGTAQRAFVRHGAKVLSLLEKMTAAQE